jgi:2-polyprenyl-6-hydroxyphenyl methylase/3-demethylubiquinone-9 3-methyltransferase
MKHDLLELWEESQRHELQCWMVYREKVNSSEYLRVKKEYWSRLLSKVIPALEITTASEVLDVGCGPAGILIALESCRRTGLDPLAEYYRDSFPFLSASGITLRQTAIEDWEASAQYDVIFMMNSLDHCRDMGRAVEVVKSALKPGGKLVVSVNVHNWQGIRWFFSETYTHVDPEHPHQRMLRDYRALFLSAGFRILSEHDIDSEVGWVNEATRDATGPASRLAAARKIARLAWANPALAVVEMLGVLGVPRHRFDVSRCWTSIFRHYMLVLEAR